MKIDLDLQERIYLTELLTERLQDYEYMSDDEIDINERIWQRLFVSAMERREYNKSVKGE